MDMRAVEVEAFLTHLLEAGHDICIVHGPSASAARSTCQKPIHNSQSAIRNSPMWHAAHLSYLASRLSSRPPVTEVGGSWLRFT